MFRSDGADGVVHVNWRTIDKTALSGKDFVGVNGVLEFKAGEIQKEIKVQIINDMSAVGKEEYFEVELFGLSEGAKLGNIKTTKVTIADDEEFQTILNNMMELTNANLNDLSLYQSSWSQQLKNSKIGCHFLPAQSFVPIAQELIVPFPARSKFRSNFQKMVAWISWITMDTSTNLVALVIK